MITERQKIYEYIEDAFDFARREGLPEDWDAVEFRRNAIKSYIDAAEAEIARLLKLLDPPVCRLQLPDGTVPANAAEAAIGWKREYDRLSKDHDAYRAAQPPAVGEDVVERAKDVIEDWLKQSRFADVDFPGIGARLIAEKLDSANLLRTKDAG